MGNKKIPFDEVISGRVTARDKKLMKDSGYRVRDAISFFLQHAVSSKKKLLVDKFLITENIKDLKKQRDDLDMEIISEERRLEEINNQLGIVELNGHEYSYDVHQAVDVIIQRFEKSHLDLDSYFESAKYKLLIENQEALLNLDEGEIENLVSAL